MRPAPTRLFLEDPWYVPNRRLLARLIVRTAAVRPQERFRAGAKARAFFHTPTVIRILGMEVRQQSYHQYPPFCPEKSRYDVTSDGGCRECTSL